jgi:hypothetical protein
MRLADEPAMTREFEAIIAADPHHDRASFETLARQGQPIIAWLEGLGVAFEQIPYYLAARHAGGQSEAAPPLSRL